MLRLRARKFENLIQHNFSNIPNDPQELKEHIAKMIEEIKQVKQDLLRVVYILDQTHMWVELEGYAWTFGARILGQVLGDAKNVRPGRDANCYI